MPIIIKSLNYIITRFANPQVTDAAKYVVNAHFEIPVGDDKRSLDVTASTQVIVKGE